MKKTAAFLALALLVLPAFSEAGLIKMTDAKGKEKSFETIADALKACKSGDCKILLAKGVYNEALYYAGSANVTIAGDTDALYGSDVVIAIDNNSDIQRCKMGSNALKNRCVLEFEGFGNLTLENLTIQNTFERGSSSGKGSQAEALGFDSDSNLACYNCSFLSHQDTLRTTGKAWFYKCRIEGDVDFIWMEKTGKTALYEECEIKSVYDENYSSHVSYICAPRMEMMPSAAKGIVILNSNVSAAEGTRTFLARTPWKDGYYNQVAYIGCKFSGIDSEIWYGEALKAKKSPNTVLGWKMDKACAENLGISAEGRDDILDDETTVKEYSGRKAILNRAVSISKGTYKKSGKVWNTDEFAAKHGWTVTADTSSAE